MRQAATLNPVTVATIRVFLEGDKRDAEIMRTLSCFKASKLSLRREYQRTAGWHMGGLDWDTGEVQS